ncbi:MAG TPA: hypothetical protein PL110_04080 [Candidatus Eremiobacteraeota bacterium]|nr:MAG: hypothetical protein BWY64_03512 [bacterium ADurb.Bin363]HPZ07266.1 hypothetical protein [Candidatus Eremiobacteraeota bacterium]
MHKIGGENQVLPRGETYIMSNLVRTIEGINVTEKDYELASKDLGVRMLSISKTLRKVSGGSLGAIGTTAGRIAASHLPRMFEDEKITFEEIIKDLQGKWKDSFKFDYVFADSTTTLTFDHCPIYTILSQQGEKVGGDLCTLFHSYLQGILVEVVGERFQLKTESMGEKCVLKVRLMPKFDD